MQYLILSSIITVIQSNVILFMSLFDETVFEESLVTNFCMCRKETFVY